MSARDLRIARLRVTGRAFVEAQRLHSEIEALREDVDSATAEALRADADDAHAALTDTERGAFEAWLSARRKKRVYVAAPLPMIRTARLVAGTLGGGGFDVVSTWHRGDDATVEREARITDEAMGDVGDLCLREVGRAGALVLLYGPPTDRHGSILETGFALGRGLRVIAMPAGPRGVLPTRLLHSARVTHAQNVRDVLRALQGAS